MDVSIFCLIIAVRIYLTNLAFYPSASLEMPQKLEERIVVWKLTVFSYMFDSVR